MPALPFNSGAAEFQRLGEDVSKRIAIGALAHAPALTSNTRILDSACGTGAVTSVIMDAAEAQRIDPPPSIVGIDSAEEMIQLYRAVGALEGWQTVSSRVQDAASLAGFADGEFDLVFMNFGIMFVKDGVAAAREIHRVLKPGGIALITTWKDGGVMNLVQRTLRAIDPAGHRLVMPEGWEKEEKLRSAVEGGGFKAHKTKVLIERTTWRGRGREDIVKALNETTFYDHLKDGWTKQQRSRWADELRNQLTPSQRETGHVDMIAWLCVAEKE